MSSSAPWIWKTLPTFSAGLPGLRRERRKIRSSFLRTECMRRRPIERTERHGRRARHSSLVALLITVLSVGGCTTGTTDRPLFKLLSPEETGVAFANTITTDDSVNVQTDVYVYNGAGVAIGDIDNDGLSDLFFSGNMVSSRLYLNKGGLRFEDVTQTAGVATKTSAGGATMVDINNDGFLDIYVSVSGPEWSTPEERKNLLFVNNGDRSFTESAARYGIADTSFSTHAAFLDYDGDGDLDLFLLNNSPADF